MNDITVLFMPDLGFGENGTNVMWTLLPKYYPHYHALLPPFISTLREQFVWKNMTMSFTANK